MSIRTEQKLDMCFSDYADELILDGEGCHVGEELKAALEYEKPEWMRNGHINLPRFRRAMKGWRKFAPMMEFVKGCVSGIIMEMGEKEIILFIEIYI